MSGPDVASAPLCVGRWSDLAAAAVSWLSAVPLVASPLAAVQTSQTRH